MIKINRNIPALITLLTKSVAAPKSKLFIATIFQLLVVVSFAQAPKVFDFFNSTGDPAGNDTIFTVPPCVTTFTVEVFGASGAGASGISSEGGAGGGGGAYSKSVMTVTPGTVYNMHLGLLGNLQAGAGGEDSWFGTATTVMAKGGLNANSTNGGAGGDAAASIGTVTFSGGDGGDVNDRDGGAAGGGATASEDGNGAAGGPDNGDFGGQGGIQSANGLGTGGVGGGDNQAGEDKSQCLGCGGGGGRSGGGGGGGGGGG